MIHKPNHICIRPCAGCAYELGVQDTKKKPKQSAKYVWMVIGSDNPCDIRRYAFSHQDGISQLKHTKSYKDPVSGGTWTLFRLARVNRLSTHAKKQVLRAVR